MHFKLAFMSLVKVDQALHLLSIIPDVMKLSYDIVNLILIV